MVRTTVFRNDTTQTVRLPRAVAFPDDVREVEVRVVGAARVIEPVGTSWDEWFDHGLRVTPDLLTDRDQEVAENASPCDA